MLYVYMYYESSYAAEFSRVFYKNDKYNYYIRVPFIIDINDKVIHLLGFYGRENV